jgi:HD-GYP domain-containing protein (c-di-GMP phosphodiesterase class II)
MAKILDLKSIENASLIRKFSVMFTFMSILPLVSLALVFYFLSPNQELKITSDILFWVVFLSGVFVFIGFIGMRRSLVNLFKVTNNAKEILSGNLSKRINLDFAGNNEVTQLAKAFNEVVEQLENNIKQLERSRNTAQEVLLKIASGVSSTNNIDTFLDLIIETTVHALDANMGVLLILVKDKNELIVKSAFGSKVPYVKNQVISLDQEVAGWVIKQKKPLLIPRLHKASETPASVTSFEPPMISTPLVFHNEVVGAITVSGKKTGEDFTEEELIILSNLSAQVALAHENSRLSADNQKTYLETINALALAVEARDVYSRGHSDRVGGYAVKIAKKLNLSAEQIRTVEEAAELHDVGKIGISDDILRKPSQLTDFERSIMEQHPVIGEGIILPLHGFQHLRDPVRHHHEWLNGEGYPDSLQEEKISIEARILTVADSFDAMTTDRPYRRKLDYQQAKDELLRYAGIRYDKVVVEALIQII